MKARKAIIGVAAILIAAFVALRVYGAYQREQDDALERAAIAEQKAKELNEESGRLKRQSDCNLLWIKYDNAVLDKRITELQGGFALTPVEPACIGHAERMDEVLDSSSRQSQVSFAALDASEYARYERLYASSRKYQTRYLTMRLWAFLTGTNPKVKPAEMVAQIVKAANLDSRSPNASLLGFRGGESPQDVGRPAADITNPSAPIVDGRPNQGWPNASLLGFRGGESPQDVSRHAADIGLTKVSVCTYRQFEGEPPDTDYTDCKFSGKAGESMTVAFYRGQLQKAEYYFPVNRYGEILEAIKKANGNPRTTDPEDPAHAFWGTYKEHFSIGIDKTANGNEGWADIIFPTPDSIQLMEHIQKAYVPPKEIPPEALTEVRKAELRLFGEKTAEVDGLEVTSGAMQGKLAVTTHCKAHFCSDHYAVWTVDLTTGEAAGALADGSSVVVYLGDYGSAEKLPQVLQSEIDLQKQLGFPSPKRIVYVSQGQ